MMNNEKSRFRRWMLFWEDQHPITRGNMVLLLLDLLFSTVMWVIMTFSPHLVDFSTFFTLASIERIWVLTNTVLLIIFSYGVLRLLWLVVRQRVSFSSFVLVCALPFVLLLPLNLMPTFFQTAVSYQMGRSYDEVFNKFTSLCDEWRSVYDQGESVLDIEDYDLTMFANIEVWREVNTVFFNMGDESYTFGLACVVRNDNPARDGRRSRQFQYEQISHPYYEFYEESA